MQRMSVTIVDFMAVLLPGVVFLFAILLAPWPDPWLAPLNISLQRIPLLNNDWAAAVCWALAAYILGFLLRLTSIEIMNRLTARRWVSRVSSQISQLEPSMKAAINDDALVAALQQISKGRDRHGVGNCAPYFHYAKRIIRTEPELWVEAERLEAEVRLAAGLFVPFCALSVDGVARHFVLGGPSPLLLVVLGSVGAVTIFISFPERRIKEVLYDYLLALIALKRQHKKTGVVLRRGKPQNASELPADSQSSGAAATVGGVISTTDQMLATNVPPDVSRASVAPPNSQ